MVYLLGMVLLAAGLYGRVDLTAEGAARESEAAPAGANGHTGAEKASTAA